jgi:hypothetical protein
VDPARACGAAQATATIAARTDLRVIGGGAVPPRSVELAVSSCALELNTMKGWSLIIFISDPRGRSVVVVQRFVV